jgi:glucose-6-phosphate 1-dehydrogenase
MTMPPLTSGVLVIFGITGDLTRRYLLPALYHLAGDNLLPEHFEIIGVTRRQFTVQELLDGLKTEITRLEGECDEECLTKLGSRMRIVTMDLNDPGDYSALKTTLDELESQRGMCLNRLFYLSIPAGSYGPVVDMLGSSGLNSGCVHGVADSRLMVEKPFGYDLASATELIARTKHSFRESQIYRIDHYLAKETAQNILTFRFSNPIFKAVWDRHAIDRIEVTAAESIGIEGRAAFYEPTGALRDLIQSHLLQVLSLVIMEEPSTLTATHVHAEKLKALEAITPVAPNEVTKRAVRGQYNGYREEVKNPDSYTETFARITLDINNDRWRGVPVIVQTGKRLDRKTTQVTLYFNSKGNHDQAGNTLTFRIQPDEGIIIDLLAKKPGFDHQTERVEMAFNYHHSFGDHVHPDAYERVLMDGIRGDQTLFATSDEVLASWRIVESVVQEWAKNADGLKLYQPGVAPADI